MELNGDFDIKNLDGFVYALFRSKTIGVFIYQDDCKIVLSNQTFREFIGYSEDELSRLTPYDIIPDEYKAEVKKLAERRIKGEIFAAEQITHMHITKDGVNKPTVIFAYTINYNGKPAGLVLVLDVSKQKMYDNLLLSFRALQTMYATLSEVNQIIVRAKDEHSLFSEISGRIVRRGLFVNSFIMLFSQDLRIQATFAYEKSDYVDFLKKHLNTGIPDIKKGPLLTSFLKSKIVINNDTLKNPAMLPWRTEQSKRGYLSSAAVPIIKKGRTIGVFSLYAAEKGFFKKETFDLLNEMKMDINYALDKIEDEKWHSMIMTALNSGSDFAVILDKYFNILFVNESAYKIFGYHANELIGQHYSKIFGGGSGKKELPEKFLGTFISGEILTDIFMYKTMSRGDVYCYTTITPYKLDLENGGDIEYFITTGKDITAEIKAEETMEQLMHFDALTGLPNKRFLKEKIDAYLKDAGYSEADSSPYQLYHCALALINPVNFSLINHTFGFETGDKIIVAISEKIKKVIKSYDILARWEADKFAVFFKRLKFDEDALHIVDRILDVLSESYISYMPDAGKKINISFNAGISLYPKDATSSQDIFDKAESALLNSRSKGENTVGFFKKEFEESARKKVELRSGLNEALAEKQFVLHYQPYFDIKTGSIRGAEALLRWQKNGRLTPPMEFIPFLEQSGMITKVENWILGEVASKIKTWSNKGLKVVPVSVNISPASFANPHIKDIIEETLRKNEVEPGFFNFEIVERTFMDNLEYSGRLLNDLKDKGFGFSIDDFGTGYSSLSYLTELPFDNLKIDISFVKKMLTDKHSRYIVETIIYLSKKLNMKSIAEGVETEEQLQLLKELGCDYIQGFLLSKPLEETKFEEFLI